MLGHSNAKIVINEVYYSNYNGDRLSTGGDTHHEFTVYLKKSGDPFSNNYAKFYAPTSSVSKKLGGGFSTSAKYYVKIENNDELSGDKYLHGSGYVTYY